MTTEKRRYAFRPFPANSLQEALQVAQTIEDHNNGKPMNRLLLANAMGRKPASSAFNFLLSSSYKYGLTLGTEKSENISLTELGTSLVRPRDSDERIRGLRNAAMAPDLLRRVFEHYNNGKIPQGEFFHNVLERNFSVPRDRCGECAQLLVENGRFAGIIRELQGSLYVVMDGETTNGHAPDQATDTVTQLERPEAEAFAPSPTPPLQPSTERYIFIAHGKNRKPLEQLEKVLGQFGIPCKVAVNEPQMARPVSVKVAQTMRECHSAILIFTADEEYKTPEGETIWRPSQNVIFELGAASILYENRIVIFKEEGLDFPTDFRDIGYISFEKDKLDAKGADLIKELIGLKLVKIQAA